MYSVSSGMNDINDLAYIRQWDGLSYLNIWDGEFSKCNKIYGRDSTIYPPFIEEEDTFDIFATDVCR